MDKWISRWVNKFVRDGRRKEVEGEVNEAVRAERGTFFRCGGVLYARIKWCLDIGSRDTSLHTMNVCVCVCVCVYMRAYVEVTLYMHLPDSICIVA